MTTVDYDISSHVTRFCRALRDHGFVAGPSESADALRAMAVVDLMSPASVYWALRAVLVSARHEVPTFDALFNRFWDFDPPPEREPRDASNDLPGRARVRAPSGIAAQVKNDPDSEDILLQLVRTGASSNEADRGSDLTVLDSDRAEQVSRVAARIVASLASRPSRRRRRHRRRGLIDMRGVLRKSLGSGGDPLYLPRRARIERTPRLLLLLDASGSMDRRAGLMLELAYGIAQHTPRLETFVFSTSVTRVAGLLAAPTFVDALRRVGDAVNHWSGGTRIGEALAHINSRYPALQDRHTTVFLVSDGWDTGEPDQLARQLRRMRRRVRKLFWLNPLLGSEGYEQATRSLVAAVDHVDRFVSIRDLEQLKKLPALMGR
jgi:uncharacterized protein with von Willebrand factor type A (vWA) domain